jgi:hypothetical protein
MEHENVGELIRQALHEKDKEALEAATYPDREIASLREHPGFNKLLPVIQRYYRGAAEKNLDEGGNRNEYWVGVRAGLTLFFTLIGDSIERLQTVDELQRASEGDLETEPGSDFITLGGSAL